MIRKLIIMTALSLGIAFAQDPYASSNTAPTNNVPTPMAEDDPAWTISIHPVSLVVLTALGLKSFYFTVERTVTPHVSVIGRPSIISFSSDYYDVSSDVSFDMLVVGVIAGARYYVNPGHKGLYFDAQLQYAHMGLDYSDSDGGKASASANGFGPYVLTGWKFRSGRATFGIDIGVGYNIMSISAEGKEAEDAEEDMESYASNGFGYDMNLTFGLSF